MSCVFFILFFTNALTHNYGNLFSPIISEDNLTTTDDNGINYTTVKMRYNHYLSSPSVISKECKQLDPIIDKIDDQLYQESSNVSEVIDLWFQCLNRVSKEEAMLMPGEICTQFYI